MSVIVGSVQGTLLTQYLPLTEQSTWFDVTTT